jgi:hypothetical protein
MDWNDVYQYIQNAKDPKDLENLNYSPPGGWDMITGRDRGFDPAQIEKMRQGKLLELSGGEIAKEEAAYPNLVDYTQATGTTDPRFWNDPESKAVLAKQGVTGDIGPFASAAPSQNPYIQASLSTLKNQALNEGNTRDVIAGKENPNILAQLFNNPTTQPHMTALQSIAQRFQNGGIPTAEQIELMKEKKKDSSEKRDLEFLTNVNTPYVTGEATPEAARNRMSEVADVVKPTSAAMEKADTILDKLFSPEKQPQYKTNLFLSKTPEGQAIPAGYVVDAMVDSTGRPIKTVGVPHKPTAVSSAEVRLAGIPTFTAVPGAFDPTTGAPIILDRRGGIVKSAKNPQNLDVGTAQAEQFDIKNLEKIKGVLTSNEIEANKNFDQLEELSTKLGNGRIPKINKAYNIIKDNLGAPEPGTAEGVAYEAATQYARVVNKQTTGGALTDTAKADALRFLNVMKMSDKQRRQKLAQYRVTMKNATASQDEAIKRARTGARNNTAPSGGRFKIIQVQ